MSKSEQYIFQPGTVVELADATELHEFEEAVCDVITPRISPEARLVWEGRTRLKEGLRPARFNGNIAHIQLEVMNEPIERLRSARERGFRFDSGIATRQNIERVERSRAEGRAIGFDYLAEALSSRGRAGQIQAELWYYGAPTNQSRNTMRRIHTKPRIESEHIHEINEDSRRIALQVVRNGIMHARSHGFHN